VRGWLSAGNRTRITAHERLLAAKHASPWPVKPRLVTVSATGWGSIHVGFSSGSRMGPQPHRTKVSAPARVTFPQGQRRRKPARRSHPSLEVRAAIVVRSRS